MTPPPESEISVGELSRSVNNVLIRFEGLAKRLEDGQFVRSDLYQARQEAVNLALDSSREKIHNLDIEKVDKSDFSSLLERVAQLEDDKKWLVRLVIGFIVLAVLGAIFVASGSSIQ